MSLKAGRRGLNKRLVDAFGNFDGEAPSGEYYTKQQTDNKFETKTHVNNTFQKKTLDVPIEMLSGSKLTVEDALQGLNEEKFTYADNGVLGAKNLLSYPYYDTSKTDKGITITDNGDGTIELNGTSTGQIQFYLHNYQKKFVPPKGRYILTRGDGGSEYVLVFVNLFSGDTFVRQLVNLATDVSAEFTLDYVDYDAVVIGVWIFTGATLNQHVLKPMLRLASDPDDTYVPYAMTNRELTEELTMQESAVTDIVSGTVGDMGNHLYKYGKVVHFVLRLNNTTLPEWGQTPIFIIPQGYRPKSTIRCLDYFDTSRNININSDGTVFCSKAITDGMVTFNATWITD